MFLYWYRLRMLMLAIGGFFFLIYSVNDSYWPRLYCNRYEDVDVDMDTGVVGSLSTQTELDECKDSFRTLCWFIWLPAVIF